MKKTSFLGKSPQTVTQQPIPVNPPMNAPSGKKHLMKAAGLMGLMTLASRILGMIRDIVSAKNFGISWQWDAFLYAFMLPNFLRRIVAEGALSSAFIPVYTETLNQHGKEAAFRYAQLLSTLILTSLALFLLAMEIVLYFALKIPDLPARLYLIFDFLRYLFPYLWLISFFAMGMGVLNCHNHFFAPSLGPVILDIFWIVGVVWIIPHAGSLPEEQLRWLTVILLLSGFVQVAVQIPPLRALGFRWKMVFDFMDASLRKTARLFFPALFGFAVVQINLLIDSTMGYMAGPGANSSLWYGNRIMQFPLGVFAIAMGTALLPAIAHHVARKEIDEARKTMAFAMRNVFFIILPCTVGLIVLSQPIVAMLFQRGEFDITSTQRTAAVLTAYSIGLFAYSGQKIITAGFYAAQDTKTPLYLGFADLAVNVTLNFILMQFFREAGLALATSLAAILEFFLLCFLFNRKIFSFPFREVVSSFARVLIASLVMGGITALTYHGLSGAFPGAAIFEMLIKVFGSIIVGAAAYIVFCFILRVRELQEAVSWMLKRAVILRPKAEESK
ncbi:MAG: murein biosynthesis integral membrane protein MurJ [Candidatus Omnitrophica bacterium]|nr:murein biosynthesis integral membrane protein MurJ [Candidatus Omnitrophota bacterium]